MQCKFSSNNFSCKEIADSSGYCIFHKKNKTELENKKFINYIKNKKITNFNGFIFEVDFCILDLIDYNYDKLNFSNVIFLKNTMFDEFHFSKKVIFDNVKFLQDVSFENCIFEDNFILNNVEFNKNLVNNKIFLKTIFNGQNLILRNCTNLPRLDDIKFNENSKIIMEDINYYKNQYVTGKINYRIAKNQAHKIGDYDRRDFYYYKEREYSYFLINKKDYKNKFNYGVDRILSFFERHIIGYENKSSRVFIISLLAISIFAIFYSIAGVKTLDNDFIFIDLKNIGDYSLVEILKIYSQMWYFSLITFSTVGYGDIIPYNIIGKALVSIEIFVGLSMVAIWTALIIKKIIK